jgi:hypothetical protein
MRVSKEERQTHKEFLRKEKKKDRDLRKILKKTKPEKSGIIR